MSDEFPSINTEDLRGDSASALLFSFYYSENGFAIHKRLFRDSRMLSWAVEPIATRHYWVDHLDPWIVHFRVDFGIRWYGAA
jgi:hypothetical protein